MLTAAHDAVSRQWSIVLFFALIILLWAMIRPSTIRDDDNRRLARNGTARTFLVVSYVLLYLVLVGVFYTGGEALQRNFGPTVDALIGATPLSWIPKDYLARLTTRAPYLGFFTLGALAYLGPCRDIERRFLIWAHGGSHLHSDTVLLTEHLVTCPYVPSDAERMRNIEGLKAFNVFLTDTETQSMDLGSVKLWRKVNVLLRLVRTWNEGEGRLLSSNEMRLLETIAQAHSRKTKLALDIVSVMAQGRAQGAAFSQVTDMLAKAPHGDPARTAAREVELGTMIGSAAQPARDQPPVRLASKELKGYLTLINDYFVVEYQLLLNDLARITAKSVVLSADAAPDRLEAMRVAGFDGLGRIEPIGVDGILKAFLTVGVGGFLIFYLLQYRRTQQQLASAGVDTELLEKAGQGQLMLLATIALVMAVAALIGCFIGSRGTDLREHEVPWRRYCGGGLLAVLAFMLIHWAQMSLAGDAMAAMREARRQQFERQAARLSASDAQKAVAAAATGADVAPSLKVKEPVAKTAEQRFRFRNLLPWSILPFLITVSICRLARMPHWPAPGVIRQTRLRRAVWERSLDGIIVGVVLALGVLLARAISELFGLGPRHSPMRDPKVAWQFVITFATAMGLLGAVVGAAVVRDTRLAAHSKIVAPRRTVWIEREAPVQAGASLVRG